MKAALLPEEEISVSSEDEGDTPNDGPGQATDLSDFVWD